MRYAKLVLAIALFAPLAGCASGGQPHMHDALDHLKEARADLEAAVSDKGGHRVKAIALVDQAIEETRHGMEFAATH